MPFNSNIFLKIIFFLLMADTLHAQEVEEKALNNAFNTFAAYQNGKIDSLPMNVANYNKMVAYLDNSFKTFILHKHSHEYKKFMPAKDLSNFKLFRLENGVEIDAVSFLVDSINYVVFGYKTQDRPNYFIKRLADNSIVFSGNGKAAYVDGIYALEKNNILLVEKTGDYNSSRRASVATTDAKQWKQVKAFKGLAFGQVPGAYFNKKFVAARIYFQLECDMDYVMAAPEDVNTIFFDEKTKILSYKQYGPNNRSKKIEAKYNNGLFMIDDYRAGEGMPAGSPAMPY